jgi:hypothetical protein
VTFNPGVAGKGRLICGRTFIGTMPPVAVLDYRWCSGPPREHTMMRNAIVLLALAVPAAVQAAECSPGPKRGAAI